jgi:two-component system OmpR family response regulator
MDNQNHILVVDDDSEIRDLLNEFLTKHHYKISTAKNGEELLEIHKKSNDISLIVLDIMMPGIDGIETCRRLRQHSNTPIIMLTAVANESDRIIGLELGADDYLVKPFHPRELLARIKAVLRRTYENPTELSPESTNKTPHNKSFQFSGWVLHPTTRRLVSQDEIEVPLSAGTYDLLLAFLERPNRVLNRDQLLDITKNRMAEPYDRSIDVQISRLRQKLEIDPKDPKIIKTVRSGGYLFASDVKKI